VKKYKPQAFWAGVNFWKIGGGYKKPKIKRGQMGKKGNEEKINNEN
jgi:hypothetical protein